MEEWDKEDRKEGGEEGPTEREEGVTKREEGEERGGEGGEEERQREGGGEKYSK